MTRPPLYVVGDYFDLAEYFSGEAPAHGKLLALLVVCEDVRHAAEASDAVATEDNEERFARAFYYLRQLLLHLACAGEIIDALGEDRGEATLSAGTWAELDAVRKHFNREKTALRNARNSTVGHVDHEMLTQALKRLAGTERERLLIERGQLRVTLRSLMPALIIGGNTDDAGQRVSELTKMAGFLASMLYPLCDRIAADIMREVEPEEDGYAVHLDGDKVSLSRVDIDGMRATYSQLGSSLRADLPTDRAVQISVEAGDSCVSVAIEGREAMTRTESTHTKGDPHSTTYTKGFVHELGSKKTGQEK